MQGSFAVYNKVTYFSEPVIQIRISDKNQIKVIKWRQRCCVVHLNEIRSKNIQYPFNSVFIGFISFRIISIFFLFFVASYYCKCDK